MNFGQLATAIGQRLGVDTSSASTRDGQAVRAFLTIRHDQLYRSFLWRASILELETTVNPTTPYVPTAYYMPTKGRVILPPIFAQVIGARLGWRSLNIQRQMLYYRADYGRFFQSGYAADFLILSECVWEFDTVQNLLLTCANAADINQPVTVDTLAADTVTVTRNNLAVTQAGVALSTDRIDNITKVVTQGQVSLGYATVPVPEPYTTVLAERISNPLVFAYGLVQDNNFAVGQTVVAASPGYQCTFVITSLTFINIYGYQLRGTPLFAAGDSPNGTVMPIGCTLTIQTANTPIVTMQATDQYLPKSQRIQLVGNPTTIGQNCQNLHILGKRSTPPYAAETDVPGINGLDGVLFALVYYDFKNRDESGGSADSSTALSEAVGPEFLTTGKPGGFLGKLIEEEVVQAAYNCRIIPSTGFGGRAYFDEPFDSSKDAPYGWT